MRKRMVDCLASTSPNRLAHNPLQRCILPGKTQGCLKREDKYLLSVLMGGMMKHTRGSIRS
jgi:hypothetical protein